MRHYGFEPLVVADDFPIRTLPIVESERLQVPPLLRLTLASTNVIESAFSIVETVCRNVKRWHGGDQRERWVGSGLLIAQKKFRRVKGYKQIPALIVMLPALKSSGKSVVAKRKAS